MKSEHIQGQLRSMLLTIDYYLRGKSSLYEISQSLGDLYLSIEKRETTKDFLDKFHESWSILEQIIADNYEDKYKDDVLNKHIPNLQSLIKEYLIEG